MSGPAAMRTGEPEGFVEEELAAIWCGLLGRSRVLLEDGFRAGGDAPPLDLLAEKIVEAFGVEVPVARLDGADTLAAMSALVRGGLSARGTARGLDPLRIPTGVAVGGYTPVPLSFAQQRLWFMQQIDPDSCLYNVPTVLRLRGRLDRDALRAALDQVIARHDVLRTRFPAPGGRPRQVVDEPGRTELEISDVAADTCPHEAAERIARQEAKLPFDLAAGPPMRARLVALSAQEHWLLLTFHHIVIDGASVELVYRELSALYLAGKGLPAPQLQYADFAAWQRDQLTGTVLDELVAYWRGVLGQDPPALVLPADRESTGRRRFRGGSVTATVEPDLVAGLRALSRRHRVTMAMTTLAGFGALLSRWADTTGVVVGIPVAGRNHAQLPELIGCLINMVPIRMDLSGEPDFAELLGRVRGVVLDATAHQELPFDRMVEALVSRRRRDLLPLFRVMFSYLAPAPRPVFAGLDDCQVEVASAQGVAKYELSLYVHEEDEGLRLVLEYDSDLFDEATVVAQLAGYQQILGEAIRQGDIRP